MIPKTAILRIQCFNDVMVHDVHDVHDYGYLWLPFGLCVHLLLDCIVIMGYVTLFSRWNGFAKARFGNNGIVLLDHSLPILVFHRLTH